MLTTARRIHSVDLDMGHSQLLYLIRPLVILSFLMLFKVLMVRFRNQKTHGLLAILMITQFAITKTMENRSGEVPELLKKLDKVPLVLCIIVIDLFYISLTFERN